MMPPPSTIPAQANGRAGIPRSPAGNFLSSAVKSPPLTDSAADGAPARGEGAETYTDMEVLGPASSAHGQGQGQGQGVEDPMARSPSATSVMSSFSIPPHPGALRRRSTDTSSLDYYWSSLAGAGASSSSSSLGVSPSPSAGQGMSVPRSPGFSTTIDSHLTGSNPSGNGNASPITRNVADVANLGRSTGPASTEQTPRQADSESNLRSYAPLNISYPSQSAYLKEDPSPGGYSDTSRYSNSESASISAPGSAQGQYMARPYLSQQHSDSESSGSVYSPFDYKLEMGSLDGTDSGSERASSSEYLPLQARGKVDELIERDQARSSVTSTSTYRPDSARLASPGLADDETHKTPIAPSNSSRPDIRPPQLTLNQDFQQDRRSSLTPSAGNITPRRSPQPKSANGSSPSFYAPFSSGRPIGLGFESLSPGELTSAHHHDLAAPPSDTPHSAPAAKSEFVESSSSATQGDQLPGDRADPRMDVAKRQTLPAPAAPLDTSAGGQSAAGTSRDRLLSPDKYARATTPTREQGDRRGSSPSPNRSPEPPPKSRLRNRENSTSKDSDSSYTPQVSYSPQFVPQSLPMILHTSSSPLPSPERSNERSDSSDQGQPRRPDRSPSRQHSPVFSPSATLSDLTEMLGGAIDAIGLIDSRDTPPPMVSEPSKRDKPLALALAPAAEVADRGPMTPTSLPARGASLPGSSLPSAASATASQLPLPQPPAPTHTQYSPQPGQQQYTKPQLRHQSSSNFSYASTVAQAAVQPPILSISVRPWPAAMLYGNIKAQKHAGDRAKGYARAINELARSESGLREWCIAASMQTQQQRAMMPNKMSSVSNLGIRSNSVPSAIPLPYQLSAYDPTPRQRNVSAGSEFPMRADSYAAREISQRVLDPADQPTALPANLPYPQLQQQAQQGYLGAMGGGGLKPSQSMQSVASFASSKKGFFSAIGRRGSSKKESLSLGPANGLLGGAPAGAAKKDVRGLPISGPRSASPQRVDGGPAGSFPGMQAPRVQGSISAPMGPRGPRMGSFTPPPQISGSPIERAGGEFVVPGRASLDMGMGRMTPPRDARASLDSSRTPKAQMYTNTSSSSVSSMGTPMPRRGSSLAATMTPTVSSSGGSPGMGPREEEVRQMADILPHVEKATLRAYLARYGDQMQAIGAYLEDEKGGSTLR
ncbi:hypothetical protein IAU60_000967 [Kwoniella sp. DSM 27419]